MFRGVHNTPCCAGGGGSRTHSARGPPPPKSLTGRPFVDITAVAENPRWKDREKQHIQDLLRPLRPSKTSGKEAKMTSQSLFQCQKHAMRIVG